jgi:hypothetical protein
MEQKKFKDLIENLMHYDKVANEWMDKVPSEINSAFFDNPYVDSIQHANSILLTALFDKPLYDEVNWFLYEWKAEKDVSLRTISFPDGCKYIINDLHDFVNYLTLEGHLS